MKAHVGSPVWTRSLSFTTVYVWIRPGPLKSRHQDRVQNTTNLLGETSTREKGKGDRGGWKSQAMQVWPQGKETVEEGRWGGRTLDCSEVLEKV